MGNVEYMLIFVEKLSQQGSIFQISKEKIQILGGWVNK